MTQGLSPTDVLDTIDWVCGLTDTIPKWLWELGFKEEKYFARIVLDEMPPIRTFREGEELVVDVAPYRVEYFRKPIVERKWFGTPVDDGYNVVHEAKRDPAKDVHDADRVGGGHRGIR